MPKYQNTGGPHQTIDGETIDAGAIFELDDQTLLEAFPGKFKLVKEEAPAPVVEPEEVAADDPTLETEPATEEVPKAAKGRTDVTDEFKLALEADMRVEKDKRGWYILDEGDDDPINEKPLLKREVEGAIREYLAE